MSKIFKPEKLSIKSHPEVSEKVIQDIIANDPSIIGLGDLIFKDKERMQPRAGRLDLLLVDPETTRRYEVEIQLGKTDECHLVRTIEYWDIEKKRYPQYDHCAVIIAEDITSRFLNVISLFNGSIPLIAIQMNAFKFGDQIGLVFTKVLDEMPLGAEDDEISDQEQIPANREYWVKKASEETIRIIEKFLEVINDGGKNYRLQYNRYVVAIDKEGKPIPFVMLRPRKKNHFVLIIKMIKSEEIDKFIEENDLDYMEYNTRASRYRIRIGMQDLIDKKEAIRTLLSLVFTLYNKS